MHIEAQYKQALDGLEEKPPLNIVTRKRVKTVGDVALLMEQLQPSVVFIDGLYKLRPNSVNKYKSNWEVIMALVDEIQELALEKEIPIVGVTQLNRGAAKQKGKKSSSAAGLEDIAFADAIGMNADVILGLLPTEETKGRNETVIQLMKNREDDIGSWLVKFDLAAMDFNEVGPYQEPSDDPDDASVGYAP
jgi:replicative DNA helicase